MMTQPDTSIRKRKWLCWIIGCRCRPSSDEVACWGECMRCGSKYGYCERTYIRRRIEADEAFKKAWEEYTLPGMTP